MGGGKDTGTAKKGEGAGKAKGGALSTSPDIPRKQRGGWVGNRIHALTRKVGKKALDIVFVVM